MNIPVKLLDNRDFRCGDISGTIWVAKFLRKIYFMASTIWNIN